MSGLEPSRCCAQLVPVTESLPPNPRKHRLRSQPRRGWPPASLLSTVSSGRPELLFPAQPLALQPVIRSGSSGPGELLRQLEMPGWLGCGVWTGQPALDEPLLQRVDGAYALVCASDKWLAFVLRVGQNGCKCGDKYCKPCVTPVLVTAERAAPVVSRSAHQPTDPEATILRLGCLRGEGWALGISAQKA